MLNHDYTLTGQWGPRVVRVTRVSPARIYYAETQPYGNRPLGEESWLSVRDFQKCAKPAKVQRGNTTWPPAS